MGESTSLLAYVIDGIANGCLYGIFGMSLVVIYRTNQLFNFAQTQIVSFILILAFFLLSKLQSYWIAALIVLLGSFLFGTLLHIVVMRTITERRTVLQKSEVLVTIGLFAIFESVSSFIFGDNPRPFPTPFGEQTFDFGGVVISAHSIGVFVVTLTLAGFISIFFKKTKLGLMMEAIAENNTAARLRGIRTSNVLALAWGLTTALSVVGGALIAPLVFVFPQMLTPVFSYSLVAIVIGGLESPFGAFVGGIMVGVVENTTSNVSFLGSELKMAGVFTLLVATLIIRPRGIWGRSDVRRV